MNEEQLTKELGRAYRALRGIYGCVAKGQTPTAATIGYHSLTLGAAARFVHEDAMDGAEYFIGKNQSVLADALRLYGGEPIITPILGSEA